MNLPRLSINRPITVLMLTAVVLALGFVAFRGLPLDLLPSLEFPVAAVITSYSGAGPREVENLVTRPIEQALATVGNVTNIYSTSSRGQSIVVVEFNWGTNMDFATLEMRERIDLVSGFLPDEADKPMVVTFDPAQIPVMALVLEGDASPQRLRELAVDVVAPRLERLEGVASVGTAGGQERQIQVLARPSALQAYGVTLEQIAQLLAAENINLPGGSVVEGGREYLLRTSGEFQSVEEIAALRIPTATGAQVALRDLARVEDTFADVTEITRLNGNPSVGLSIQKEAQANTVEVARRVRAEIERIEADLGPGYRLLTVFDQAEFIELSIQQLVENALVGAVLAGLVLLLFLRNLRATLVVVLSIPISVVATFVLVYFAGISLNIISLGGLALGVGMLVDNSIVVLESIFRHRTEGKPAREAADVGAREVAMAITASTLTTVAVFVPVLFIEGIASQIFRDLALTVAFSLTASLVVAVTLVPLLSSRMLAAPSVAKPPATRTPLERIKDVYGRALAWTLRHRRLVALLTTLAVVGSLSLVPRIGAEFIPETDQGIITMTVTMPVGTPLAETSQVMERLEAEIRAIPEVATVYSTMGSGSSNLGFSLGGGTGGDQATLQITLVPLDERSRSSTEVAEEIRMLASRVPGIEYSVSAANMMVSLGGSPISIELRGENEVQLMAVAEELAARIRAIPGTREVETSIDTQRPEYTVQIRRERAGELGLTAPQIASAVQTAVDGKVATRFRGGGEEVDVLVRLVPEARQNLDALSRIPIASPVAGMIPLSEAATLTLTSAPLSLNRSNQARVISVTGQVVGRDLGSVMQEVQREIEAMNIPASIQVDYTGQVELMAEAFEQLGLALILAVFLVYAIMASQFESLRHPLAVMFTMPLAVIGVLFGLWVTGHTINVPSLIGIILLAGIVVNNAIVLVDYVNLLRREGMAREEALIEAGRTRLRPILMTALTTILGMLPLALGIGEGAEIQAPLAVAVVFGLTFATFLTLFIIPLAYQWTDDLGRRFSRRKPQRELPGPVPGGHQTVGEESRA